VDSLRFLEVIPRYAVPVVTRFPELWEPVYGGAEAFLTIYRRRR
jgi:hypothetical protein